jgi:hypothetical protein
MNGAIIQRGLDSQGISRGVKNEDVFSAYRDVLAAGPGNASRSEAPGADHSEFANSAD